MTGTAGRREELDLRGRLKMFDPDGTLVADCREIWTLIESEKEALCRKFWTGYGRSAALPTPIDPAKVDGLVRRILPYLESKHVRLDEQGWVDQAAEHVAGAAGANISLTSIFAGCAELSAAVQEIIVEKTIDEPERCRRLVSSYTRMALLQVDVYAAHYDRLAERSEERRVGKEC